MRTTALIWFPMEFAPKDREIIVYAPSYEDLPELVMFCQWHPDAGFYIDELRSPTRWIDKPTGGSDGIS